MKETRADTQRALLQAIGLHILLFGLMFAGLLWTRSNVVVAAAGEPIEADLVDPSALSAAMRSALKRAPAPIPVPPGPVPVDDPIPAPLPEPVVEPAPSQALPPPVPDPSPVEQEKVQRDAPSPDVAKVPREQDAKRREPPQVDPEAQRRADQKLAQQKLDAERERLAKLEQVRKELDKARRDRTMAEQQAQQLADARANAGTGGSSAASPPPGNRGADAGLLAQYAAAIQQAVLRQWVRPESVQFGQKCRISIRQLPGGHVQDVSISPSCPFDELGRQSVERAVLKASPLPYAGFESVFDRNLNLNFVAEDR